jgi:ribosomal protein S4
MTTAELLVKCGVAKSKREATDLINQGSIKINGIKLDNPKAIINLKL